MIFRKIIGVIAAVLTFILLFVSVGFAILTIFPDYKYNFFISLILILILSSIARKVYRLIVNSSRDNNESNSGGTDNELESDDDYEYLSAHVKKPGFPFKKKDQDIHDEINNKK